MAGSHGKYVGRGGDKLHSALDAFGLDVRGRVCADFGCNVGGFTDCLLARGAARVFAVDTGYGQLAWKLRNDPRVVVMERTNALYCDVPEAVDLVVIDAAWTPQKLIVPAAAQWLRPAGRIVSLLKPHYELAKLRRRTPHAPLSDEQVREVRELVGVNLAQAGFDILAHTRSPLAGKGTNPEFFLLIASRQPEPDTIESHDRRSGIR